ncbi:MAG: M14 family zinc carboxypeptidase [Cellvibrionaceae bacterium]
MNHPITLPVKTLLLISFLLISFTAFANTVNEIDTLCKEIGRKLGSVSIADCKRQNLQHSGQYSTDKRPLAYKTYPPRKTKKPLGKVLLMGGIHGDEYSAISIMFKWMNKLNQHHSGLFHWQVVPLMNPDGLLKNRKAQRQNANGVDLNRNFPSTDWEVLAQKYWKERTYKNPRRYPGPQAMSEVETRWFADIIDEFKPDAIIAVHAPHRLVDYDGPQKAPSRLGALRLRQLGTYPGSLGNYAGIDLELPVVTVELASAGIMPSDKEISRMWVDLVRWLKREVPKQRLKTTEERK